jgi:hypothetical protein
VRGGPRKIRLRGNGLGLLKSRREDDGNGESVPTRLMVNLEACRLFSRERKEFFTTGRILFMESEGKLLWLSNYLRASHKKLTLTESSCVIEI